MMKNIDTDILKTSAELKKMPFTVPEGYFDQLRKDVMQSPKPKQVRITFWNRLMPYVAVAAMFIFILVLGKIFVKPQQQETDELTAFEDYMVFSDDITDIAIHNMQHEQYAENEIDEEDIIEYLIYIGAEIDELY